MQISKYEPLEGYLRRQRLAELPMRFNDVEGVLGFRLPPSARAHPAWWSNNVGTNVAVKAWRNAGWKTSRVDVGGERVVFVRESPTATADAKAQEVAQSGALDILLRRSELSSAALRLLEDISETDGVDLRTAVVALLDKAVLERRRAMLNWFAEHATKPTNGQSSDSVDLIREDRDRDEY